MSQWMAATGLKASSADSGMTAARQRGDLRYRSILRFVFAATSCLY
jgi:hypothetical protein